MKLLTTILFITTVAFSAISQSDNCTDATILCSDQTLNSTNASATSITCSGCEDGNAASGNFCYEINNTVWFSFTTNPSGGDVSISITDIICDNTTGFNQNLQGTIIAATTPCDESTYTSVSNCESGSASDFTLNAIALSPNTTYYVQIDGDSIVGDVSSAQCGFNITVSGSGVEYEIDAGPSSTIFEGDFATLSGTGPPNSVWTPTGSVADPSNPTTTVSPEATTTYYYSYETSDGCVFTDNTIIVVSPPIGITNTLTPNNDGYNDYWKIYSIESFLSAKVTVFDRWGQKVFDSVGYSDSKNWDGTLNGNGSKLPSGVYYYVVDLNTESQNDIFSGFVTIIR